MQTCKVQHRQLEAVPITFPRVRLLDLSGYAWLTDVELLAFKVCSLLVLPVTHYVLSVLLQA